MEELDGDRADVDRAASGVGDEVGVAEGRHLLHVVGFVGLDVERHRRVLEQLGSADDVHPHHRAAHVIGVIVRPEHAHTGHAIGLEDVEDAPRVVCRVHDHGVARFSIPDQIDEVDHLLGKGVVLCEVDAGEQLAEIETIVCHLPNPRLYGVTDRPRIAFQGVPGAYSHMACTAARPDMAPIGFDTFAEALAAVESGDCELGMIAIENSLGGRVADIHHLLPGSNLHIIDEHFQPVRHQLLAPKGATLDSLKTIASHEQGLAQCRALFRELGAEPLDFGDTAGAAREAAERNDPTFGAIASELAAEIYGLEILRSRIEDKLGNTTRFIIMSRSSREPDPLAGPAMTSILFQTRSIPGALYKALGGFATNGVNIVKLESYITDQSFNVAQFYAEFEGHPSDPAVANAFDELQFFCTTLRRLGTYPRSPWRDTNPAAG